MAGRQYKGRKGVRLPPRDWTPPTAGGAGRPCVPGLMSEVWAEITDF